MKRFKTYTVAYKRKREGKTNYRTRLKLLSSHKPRLVIRRSLKNIIAQAIEYQPIGDRVLVSASSKQLQKYFGWGKSRSNKAAAYLTGFLLGKKAKDTGIKEMVLDIGDYQSTKGSRVYALLKGMVDNGINIPHSKEVLPSEELINGKYKEEFMDIKKKILEGKTKI